MNVLILYKSYSRMNTENVTKAMAEVLNATLLKVRKGFSEDIPTNDLIWFGTEIYGGKSHDSLLSPRPDPGEARNSTRGTRNRICPGMNTPVLLQRCNREALLSKPAITSMEMVVIPV